MREVGSDLNENGSKEVKLLLSNIFDSLVQGSQTLGPWTGTGRGLQGPGRTAGGERPASERSGSVPVRSRSPARLSSASGGQILTGAPGPGAKKVGDLYS